MITVICDRCGTSIPASGEIGYLAWNFRDGLEGDLMKENVLERKHFCRTCMDAIRDYIDSAPGGSGGEDSQYPAPKAGKKRVDSGKVLALKKAGWNVHDIADDMGISLQTVYKVLRTHKAVPDT